MENAQYILKSLIDNLQEGIHIVDNNGRTIYYNKSMAEMEGLKPEEVMGKKVIEYLSGVEEDSSTLMNALKNNKKYVDIVQHYSGKNKKNITTINSTIPVRKNGIPIAAIEISKDMTVLKELNEKICKLQGGNDYSNKNYCFNDIIGESQEIRAAVDKAKKASISSASVLIYAETGCGKELFAQSIHYNGSRKDKPFIAINCAAIPAPLLEGMLFGTVKGSFTGAENKKGLFEEANRGTILLDEINSMDTTLQSKLLRVLQDGYIRPLGSNKTIDIDVRIIATLNEEPEKLMKEGTLRKDFYYRISVIRINIPPLRERKDDISIFVNKYIEDYNKLLVKDIKGLDKGVLDSFFDYDWPGNVRELKNVIESAVNLTDNKDTLTKEYFDSRIIKSKKEDLNNVKIDLKERSLEEYLDYIEKQIIFKMLQETNFNISETSRKLKMTRQNLQYKIKKYDIKIKHIESTK